MSREKKICFSTTNNVNRRWKKYEIQTESENWLNEEYRRVKHAEGNLYKNYGVSIGLLKEHWRRKYSVLVGLA